MSTFCLSCSKYVVERPGSVPHSRKEVTIQFLGTAIPQNPVRFATEGSGMSKNCLYLGLQGMEAGGTGFIAGR